MSSFCSNSGPMFIVGAVGTTMLISKTAGYILLVSHILGAFFNGFLYRKLKDKTENKKAILFQNKAKNLSFADIIESSCKSILIVGTIISFFFIIIEFLSLPLGFLDIKIQSLLFGLVEITKGCQMISQNFGLRLATILSSFVITFGGISTIIQSTAVLKPIGISAKIFTIEKTTQAILSCSFAIVFSYIFL